MSLQCDPQGVGNGRTTYPRVFGASHLDLWLRNGHPQGGAYPNRPCPMGACPDRPFQLGACPDRPLPMDDYPDRPCPMGACPHRPLPTDPASRIHRPIPMGGGSRQGSTLHSHRSSRDSGDDLWADHRPDRDPLRVALTIPLWTATVTPTSPLFITSFSPRKRGSLYFVMM